MAVPGAFLFGAGALPAGWLGDRWSKTTLLEIYFYGTGAMTILTGFAQTPLMLAVGLAGIGIFASIYHPVGMSWLVSRTSKPELLWDLMDCLAVLVFFWLLWLQEH